MNRTVENLAKIIDEYLRRNNVYQDDAPWEISKSELGGYGIFAKRPIETGELIFKDVPVILGPRAALSCPEVCVNCYAKSDLELCEKKCGLKLCKNCKDCNNHQKECKIIRQWQSKPIDGELSVKLFKVLSPIRSILLSDEDKEVVKVLKAHKAMQHGFEVDVMKNMLSLNLKEDDENFMRFVCAVMDANAFEVIVGTEDNQSSVKGLYPLGSLANHSCSANANHVFNSDQQMVVTAARFIPKNAEIFHSYSRFIWGTATRRFHLYKTKHFLCKCERCQDPTEFGSYLSAIYCKICKSGMVLPIDPLTRNSKWQCNLCGELMERNNVAAVTSLLGSVINSFGEDDVDYMLKFLNVKLPLLAPPTNEAAMEVKYKLIWILGHREGYTWTELSDQLLDTKQTLCTEILNLIDTLRLGQCKIRGLILYELYCCQKEIKRRTSSIKYCPGEMKKLLQEASIILKDDVGAPLEIKTQWL